MEIYPQRSSASVEIVPNINHETHLPKVGELLSLHVEIDQQPVKQVIGGEEVLRKASLTPEPYFETITEKPGKSPVVSNIQNPARLGVKNGPASQNKNGEKIIAQPMEIPKVKPLPPEHPAAPLTNKIKDDRQPARRPSEDTDENGSSSPGPTPARSGQQSADHKQAMAQRTILSVHGIILGKVIGTGNYAKVKIAYSEELGKRVAVKIISKLKAPEEYTRKFLPREIETVKGLHHENLIQFYQSIETNHRVYLVMQLAENGTLLDFVREKKHLAEPLARNLFRQLISAIGYIHSKGVVHRDIKCENLLLDSNYNLKLIDFGFARKDFRSAESQVILSRTFCGSYAYASPEILKGIAYDPIMSDTWAAGVVCYAMVFGRLPYDGSNVNSLLKRINSSLIFPKNPPVSTECKYLLLHILAPLKIRYTIQQIKVDRWHCMP